MSTLNKVVSWAALLLGVVALVVAVGGNGQQPTLGAAGTRFPNGLTINPAAATSTIKLEPVNSAFPGCIEITNTSGTVYRWTASSTGVLIAAAGTCS